MNVQTYLHPTAWILEEDDDMFHVSVYWSGGTSPDQGIVELDRPCTGGIVLGNRKTAERLAKAINAGAVYTNPEIRTDVNGATYVQASSRVLGRRASADLKRLGF